MNNPIEIREYKKVVINQFNYPVDDVYLNETFLSKQPKSFEINWSHEHKANIENTSYAGIIQLRDVRIHFSTKVKTNLFYMMCFLKSEKNFVFDPNRIIEIEEGGNFFDVLGRLFFNEVQEIIDHGLLKKYVKREENLKYLKGKLLLQQQINQNILLKPKFYCRYHDLTCDNVENQILLRAINLLIPMIRFNEELKYELLRLENYLKEEVSLNLGITQRDCESIQYDRVNQHYKTSIDFSRLIFEENFIRSVNKGVSKGFNFIVNMWQVYEDFVTEMIEEVIREDPSFSEYVVVTQGQFKTLVKEKNIITKPDIVIKKKNTDEYPLIIDAKYKGYEANADFYQVIAYSLAIPTSKKCCLLYPKDPEQDKHKEFTVYRDVLRDEQKVIKLYTETICLFDQTDEDFKHFIIRIKKQIKELLVDLLDLG